MKTIKFLMATLISISLLISCSKDNDPIPLEDSNESIELRSVGESCSFDVRIYTVCGPTPYAYEVDVLIKTPSDNWDIGATLHDLSPGWKTVDDANWSENGGPEIYLGGGAVYINDGNTIVPDNPRIVVEIKDAAGSLYVYYVDLTVSSIDDITFDFEGDRYGNFTPSCYFTDADQEEPYPYYVCPIIIAHPNSLKQTQ